MTDSLLETHQQTNIPNKQTFQPLQTCQTHKQTNMPNDKQTNIPTVTNIPTKQTNIPNNQPNTHAKRSNHAKHTNKQANIPNKQTTTNYKRYKHSNQTNKQTLQATKQTHMPNVRMIRLVDCFIVLNVRLCGCFVAPVRDQRFCVSVGCLSVSCNVNSFALTR